MGRPGFRTARSATRIRSPHRSIASSRTTAATLPSGKTSRSPNSPGAVRTHFRSISAALHRAPAAGSAARGVEVQERTIVGRTRSNPGTSFGSERRDGVARDGRERLGGPRTARTRLPRPALQHGRQIGERGEQIDDVDLGGGKFRVRCCGESQLRDRSTETEGVAQFPFGYFGVNPRESGGKPSAQIRRRVEHFRVSPEGSRVREIERERSGIEPPAGFVRGVEPLAGRRGECSFRRHVTNLCGYTLLAGDAARRRAAAVTSRYRQ